MKSFSMAEMSKAKIGLFPGTFDPIHLGHVGVAHSACQVLSLDALIFIPNNLPPHKELRNPAPAHDRYSMAQIAILEEDRFFVSDFEICSGGVNYTIETLEHFKSLYPQAELWLIIGGDSLNELHTWKRVEEYHSYVRIAAFARGKDVEPELSKLPDALVANMVMINDIDYPQSSTETKSVLANGGDTSGHLDSNVARYIAKYGLYAD